MNKSYIYIFVHGDYCPLVYGYIYIFNFWLLLYSIWGHSDNLCKCGRLSPLALLKKMKNSRSLNCYIRSVQFFGGRGLGWGGILKCGLTSCKVILVAAYPHLSPFACPGIRGSFSGWEVCLDTQSPYCDRSLPPILISVKKVLFQKLPL